MKAIEVEDKNFRSDLAAALAKNPEQYAKTLEKNEAGFQKALAEVYESCVSLIFR